MEEEDDLECRIVSVEWGINNEISSVCNVPEHIAAKVIQLMRYGNTVPFISRYRKEVTGGLEPDVLYAIKQKNDELKAVVAKISSSLKKLSVQGVVDRKVRKELKSCKSMKEVEMIMEPFKSNGPRTLAGRAQAAGLQPIADKIFKEGRAVNMDQDVPKDVVKAVGTKAKVKEALTHIMADEIAKNSLIRNSAILACDKTPPMFCCKETSKKKSIKSKQLYSRYFNYSRPINSLMAHQVLAICRAEKAGVLTVTVEIKPETMESVQQSIYHEYLDKVHMCHRELFSLAVEGAWTRLLKPFLVRHYRSRMNEMAVSASIEVFSDNLRNLLMTAPLRRPNDGSCSFVEPDLVCSSSASVGDRLPVVGLDPGFRHGCKWAACDPHGDVIGHGVLYLAPRFAAGGDDGKSKLIGIMTTCGIGIVALGNGCGSRETEAWLLRQIKQKAFGPLDVRYSIVSEAGASVYSASEIAQKELPDLPVELRGAVSIARRLQDPMSELVKIEPRHLGVGMYQHDIEPRRLASALDNVLEECISFVGLDLNAAPPHMLARVAGLTPARAQAICEYRAKNGAFRSRSELLNVKGIGAVTFNQCAGFLRVRPSPVQLQQLSHNVILDDTDISDVSRSFLSVGGNNTSTGLTSDVSRRKAKRRSSVVCASSDDDEPAHKRRCTSQNLPKVEESMEVCDEEVKSSHMFNPLDQTAVHPMTYDIVTKIIKKLHWTLADLGNEPFRARMRALLNDDNLPSFLAEFCTEDIGFETLRDCIEYLSRPLDFDERKDSFVPLFRENARTYASLKVGMHLNGRVSNSTTFGAFVDCGLPENCFISVMDYPLCTTESRSKACRKLCLGDRITARVAEIDKGNKVRLDNVVKLTHEKVGNHIVKN